MIQIALRTEVQAVNSNKIKYFFQNQLANLTVLS